MSRIGERKILIPSGVEAKISKNHVDVKGPKGSLSRDLSSKINLSMEDGNIVVSRSSDEREDRSLHGVTRTEIANMIDGVTKGYEKVLEINGVGYKAQVQGKTLVLNLGFSHPVNFPLPDGISASVDKQTIITIRGIDKFLVGQVASNIRAIREPEPYKGKGIKYSNEKIIRKEGKTGKGK